ncbi:hypothetical protein BGZ97_005877 [Linnemannia gamsii]|uniref:Uncharacterized protein n=1 Tax=Linnemannia gamsii TaxID=64522 RepID=A0A9P6QQC5_9FUNG|nr:hypothetical protein BGZ97_005877 [Linnemannia gamsii]
MRSQLFNNAREIQELRTNEFLRAKGLQSCLRRRKASAPLRKPSKPASKKQKSTPSHYPLTKRPAVDQGEEAEAVAAAAVGVAAISTTVSSNNNDHLTSNSTSSNSPITNNTVQRIRQRPRSNNNVAKLQWSSVLNRKAAILALFHDPEVVTKDSIFKAFLAAGHGLGVIDVKHEIYSIEPVLVFFKSKPDIHTLPMSDLAKKLS